MTLQKHGQPQELGDCDLCVEFAHFLSNSITLEKNNNKITKTKARCFAVILTQMDTDVSFVSRVNTQGNLITVPAEFYVTYGFAIYLCSQKYKRKIERSKNLPKCFSLMVTFYIPGSKLNVVFMSQILLLMQNILFPIDRPENFRLLFLKLCINIYLLCINICFE